MMRQKQGSRVCYPAWAGLALVACLTAPPPARADGPMLLIRLAGGEQAIYAVSEVQRIVFDADTLVVVKAGGSERYAAASITKIEFLMEFSGVNDPRDAAALVKAVHLFQNQPNPFSPETRIAFDVPKAGPVELVIYSVNGRLIRRLVKDTRPAGRHTANWDGRDDAGEKVGSGIYFYQLTAPGVEESRRMILLP
jgi:hypothetical protein